MPMTKSEINKRWNDKNREKKNAHHREMYRKNHEAELKRCRIKHWKERGIICDYEAIYQIYINTHACDFCKKPFKSSQDRQLDHCHDTGMVRAILCICCNTRDVLNTK